MSLTNWFFRAKLFINYEILEIKLRIYRDLIYAKNHSEFH